MNGGDAAAKVDYAYQLFEKARSLLVVCFWSAMTFLTCSVPLIAQTEHT